MRLLSVLILVIVFIGLSTHMISNAEYSEDDWLPELIDYDPLSAYTYASTISNMTIDTKVSGYSYRVAGSQGEYQVFLYIKNLLLDWNLDVVVHEFDFINWNIPEEPLAEIRIGNETLRARVYPIHYSIGTPQDGLNSTVEVLPLPKTFTYDPLPENISEIWDRTNISDRIVLVGREIRFNRFWLDSFNTKLLSEHPLAIMYTWMTDSFKHYPLYFSSAGGRRQPYLELQIPVFWVPKNIAERIIEAKTDNLTVSCYVKIPIITGEGKARNIIASIGGADPTKTILITAHYDSVMTGGLADNAAGTAGCLELAWVLSKAVAEGIYRPPINITFVFFSAEEAGLVGSLMFYRDYIDFLERSVVGVINLDTLGSFNLEVSSTSHPLRFLDEEYYLTSIMESAASDLELSINIFSDNIHSDDSTFEHTDDVISLVESLWPEIHVDITKINFIPAAMLGSSPYIPWYPDDEGHFGWIHTPYDNTTSTNIFDWVNPQRLETQIKVAGIALLDILRLYEKKEKRQAEPIPILILSLLAISATFATYIIIRRKKKT